MSIKTEFIFAGYQKVEYIKSTGNQYIDTGYTYNGSYLKIEMDLQFDSYAYGGTGANCPFIYGVIGRSYGNLFMSLGAENHYFGIATGTQIEVPTVATLGTKFETMLEYSSGKMNYKFNDISGNADSTGTFYQNKSIPLFCRRDYNGSLYSYFATDLRLYSCKIYSVSGTLVRDFYPVYRKSDNVIGMLDIVNKVFYTNQGSGSFTKGPNV